MNEDLAACARAAFGWQGAIRVSAGPRGALGQMWRVENGPACYALKEIFDEPPTEVSIRVELEFARRAAESGVLVPNSHPDRAGHYLVTAPGGTWLRCYDWVDLRPLPGTAETSSRLGALLARLHRCAPAGTDEPNGGGPADPWYDTVPATHEWADLMAAVSSAHWTDRLAGRLAELPQLCAAVRPVEPARLTICHRDLHPENVHVDPTGTLVVVDWDDMGPAEPGQELARALFDWCCDETRTHLDGVRAMVEAYLTAGGPGRVTEPADFSMLLASRLNFLLSLARTSLDPLAQARHRQWADREADAFVPLLPTSRQLADVLTVARDYFH